MSQVSVMQANSMHVVLIVRSQDSRGPMQCLLEWAGILALPRYHSYRCRRRKVFDLVLYARNKDTYIRNALKTDAQF